MTFANWKAYLTLYLLIIAILSASYQQQQKQMIIDFGISTRLANIMTGADRKDNYYVDINVHDPYVGSPTLGLEMLDWTGINLSPNHYIMQKFNRARSHQQNVLAFIGQQSRFSALQYSSSQKSNDGKSIEKYMVPEISLSELCIKYYQKRPNVIVIGPNSNANQVLFGNNWGDIRCHPDVFLISNIQEQNYKNSSIQPPKQNYNFLLNTKSYVKSQIQMGNYSLYIRNNVMTQYMSNYERIQKYLQNQNIISLDKLVQQMNKVFYQQIDIMNIQSSPVLLYYVKKNQIITQNHIRKINHQKLQSMKSKQGSLPPRALPFILINYRSEQNYFILNTCDFLINKIIVNPNNLTQNISFINVNINSHGEYRQKLSVFLINYQSNIQWTPKISVINQVCVKYYQTTLQEDYVPPSLQKNLTLQQSSAVNQNSQRGLQLESIIFQTLFSVTFLCMFLIVATIMIVFLCRSLTQEQKIKDLIIQNSKMNLSQIISSPV